ncbi:hypothetical protein [Streptomyces griseorubiginosus]|uniref:hypothetical protein n=1 Tax=Streptomyces griseorubiginosus TaxID=67304 RepID=UPI0036E6CBBD
MSVHVEELHSEVVPSGAGGAGGAANGPEPRNPWAAEEHWEELRRRAVWLAARIGAEDFDD